MSKEKSAYINELFIYEKISEDGTPFWEFDLDANKFKYLLARIKREDGHLHFRGKLKDTPTPTGLFMNLKINRRKNPEYFTED